MKKREMPFVKGDIVKYKANVKNPIYPPKKGELGIISEESNYRYAVKWKKHGWQAWFDHKELKFVKPRSFKSLEQLEKAEDEEYF